jgi:hypothetical protein
MQKLDFVRVEETDAGERVYITLSPAPGTSPYDDANGSTSEDGEE